LEIQIKEKYTGGIFMRLKFIGDTNALIDGIQVFSDKLGFSLGEGGIIVNVKKTSGDLLAKFDGTECFINYNEKIHFFRALGLLVENLEIGGSFSISETPNFDTSGVMLDVSRNAVPTVKSIKDYLYYMAVMGLNMMMLYTEDIYELDKVPYFGHMRGRYSKAELCACDDYADRFGIEIIPCIQTLGHLSLFLNWAESKKYADTASVLLTGDEDVLNLIDKMLETMSTTFRSRRIHLGMDETNDLGLGKYLRKNGYKNQTELFLNHLNRVAALAEKHGLKPMIWSDMLFHVRSTGYWYEPDLPMPDGFLEAIPKNLDLVYWDYYHDDKEFYDRFIDYHYEMDKKPIFAGGIWIWTSIAPDYRKTYVTTNSALTACKEKGVKEVFATMWMGSVSPNVFSTLLGLQLYAEHTYHKTVDDDLVNRRFKFCTKANAGDFKTLSRFDNLEGVKSDYCEPPNTAYSLLWQDVLLGFYDKEIEGADTKSHYEKLAADLDTINAPEKLDALIFDIAKVQSRLLALKGDMGIRLKKAYDGGDKDSLTKICRDELPQVIKLAEETHELFRRQWFETNKPFGFEVADSKYSTLTGRLKSAKIRLEDYLSGTISEIPELAEERLPLILKEGNINGLHWAKYQQLFTTGITFL
jgi:hexosaminidase